MEDLELLIVDLEEVREVLMKIRLLMDDLEDMICKTEPETKDLLLYIYSEIEDIYNVMRGWCSL
jgi:hypothetical protein